MKTILAIIVSAMLAACGNSSTDTPAPAPDAASSAPDAQTKGAGGSGRR